MLLSPGSTGTRGNEGDEHRVPTVGSPSRKLTAKSCSVDGDSEENGFSVASEITEPAGAKGSVAGRGSPE